MQRCVFMLGCMLSVLLLAACGSQSAAPPASNAQATQTRAVELAERATLTAPTAVAAVQPGGNRLTPPPGVSTVQGISATATSTPRPTVTPSPTATSPPSPTVPPRVDVAVENVANYRDSIGSLYFIGEVVNKGQTEAANLQVAISLLGDGGQTLASGSAASFGVDILQPGEKTVWRALLNNKPESWKEERVQVQAGPVPSFVRETTYRDLKTEGVTLAPPENQYSWVKANGQVINTGTSSARSVRITVALYDDTGKLIAVSESYARLEQVPAGSSAPFSIDFTGTKQIPPKFDVYASGSRVR